MKQTKSAVAASNVAPAKQTNDLRYTKELAFNWRGYDMLSNEFVADLITKLQLPHGVTVVNKFGK